MTDAETQTQTQIQDRSDDGIVGGLLARLSDDAAEREEALRALRACPDLLVGEPQEGWLPLALDAAHPGACRDRHEWIAALPGVQFVEVISVDFVASATDVPAAR